MSQLLLRGRVLTFTDGPGRDDNASLLLARGHKTNDNVVVT